MSRSNTTALAMMRRPTQGVMRLEGDDSSDDAFNSETPTLRRFLEPAQPGGSTDPLAQLGELDAHRPGRLGQETGGRHARQGVYL